ncbi:MAG: hypothetical protein OXN89_22620 [Bryobacterales bacterium]|nr:hypothetical protein [Bryobacterales bacterium]
MGRAATPIQAWAADAAHQKLPSALAAWITHAILPDLGIVVGRVSDDLTEVLGMLKHKPWTWADRMRDEGQAQMRAEMQRSMVAMLLEMAELRFGSGSAERLANVLEGITDTDRLKEIGRWAVACESCEALLARIQES